MKLHHLTLEVLVDAAYHCGAMHERANLYIAAPTGTGKTIATRTLREVKGISYLFGKFTPSEYVKTLGKVGSSHLLIHDDIGRIEKRYFQDLISIWSMMGEDDGAVHVQDYGRNLTAQCTSSVVLISTLEQQHNWFTPFADSGLSDRFLPLRLKISDTTKGKHLAYLQKVADDLDKKWEEAQAWGLGASWCDDEDIAGAYPSREPGVMQRHKAMDITDVGLSSRHSRILIYLSRYLTPPQLGELVRVVTEPSAVYEI